MMSNAIRKVCFPSLKIVRVQSSPGYWQVGDSEQLQTHDSYFLSTDFRITSTEYGAVGESLGRFAWRLITGNYTLVQVQLEEHIDCTFDIVW